DSVTTNDAGNYSVIVANPYGFVTSAEATLTVLPALEIVAQPLDTIVTNSSTATFTVTVGGRAPFQYQWVFQGTNVLADQTNATLIITNAQAPHAGRYTVQVSNSAGAITSLPANLTVRVLPFIISQPAGLTVTNGFSASFTVAAGGTAPLAYQWFF